MIFLMGEILFGLIAMTITGFILGWITRGIRERIKRRRIDS